MIYIRDLLYELVLRDLKLRYKRSNLGLVWSLLNPLLQLLVFSLVFTFIVPIQMPHYTIFLFIGILVWTWFAAALYAATTCIVENPSMIRHPGFPVSILPVITVTSNLIHFLLADPILAAFLIAGGFRFTAAMLALPFVMAIQFLLT
jgi:lipopolysaccharide transport system permease protein